MTTKPKLIVPKVTFVFEHDHSPLVLIGKLAAVNKLVLQNTVNQRCCQGLQRKDKRQHHHLRFEDQLKFLRNIYTFNLLKTSVELLLKVYFIRDIKRFCQVCVVEACIRPWRDPVAHEGLKVSGHNVTYLAGIVQEETGAEKCGCRNQGD